MNRHERETDTVYSRHSGDSMMGMMAMMMAMCAGVLLLVAVLPMLGMPLGVLVAFGAAALMIIVHRRFMRHDG